jgi:diguanylate cyclase (GGDEF)-like protein
VSKPTALPHDATTIAAAAREAGNAALPDDVGYVAAWIDDARRLVRQGDAVPARAAAERALSVLAGGQQPEVESRAHGVVAEAFAAFGQLDSALEQATHGLAIAQTSGDGQTRAHAFRILGDIHGELRQFDTAAQCLARAAKDAGPVDGADLRAEIHASLCHNALCTARVAETVAPATAAELRGNAVDHGRQALALARRGQSPHCEALASLRLGQALLEIRDIDGAVESVLRASGLAVAHRFAPLGRGAELLAAEIDLLRGATDDARRRARAVAFGSAEAGASGTEFDAWRLVYRAAKAAGDFAAALAAHERMFELDEAIRGSVAQARAREVTDAVETQNARLEAEKARLEAELLRLKSRRLESEKRALEVQARELDRHANQDPLTGLWNRRHIDDELPRMIADARTRSAPISVAIGDIDLFKSINDRFGHPAGDAVLCTVADLLRDNCRPSDTVARVGGEEFLLVLEDSDPRSAWLVCERLRRAIERHPWTDIHPDLRVTISFGLSGPGIDGDARDFQSSADRNLYAAKRNGRNQVVPGRS